MCDMNAGFGAIFAESGIFFLQFRLAFFALGHIIIIGVIVNYRYVVYLYSKFPFVFADSWQNCCPVYGPSVFRLFFRLAMEFKGAIGEFAYRE